MEDKKPTGFHYKEGWHFRRLNDAGTVRVHYPSPDAPQGYKILDIDLASWASLVASVSAKGDTAETFQRAHDLHQGKPKCPEHSEGQVMKASQTGTDRSVWVCLTCGKRLGDAGPREEPIKKSFTIKDK